MKKIIVLFIPLVTVLITSISAQEEGSNDMDAWQEFMNPGPMHEILAQRVGEWKAEVKMWMDPSQPPTLSEAKTICEPMLGGRYFKATHTGNMMGMPYEGYEINGYDNLKKEFFNVWIDNMGTGVMMNYGSYDETNNTLNYNGLMTGPTGDDMEVRMTVKLIDNNNSIFEMFADMDGQEVKWMEIKYIRTK